MPRRVRNMQKHLIWFKRPAMKILYSLPRLSDGLYAPPFSFNTR